MNRKNSFFKKGHPAIGGYYIPVRNSWNFKIESQHITETEKKLYEETFGENIITDEEFMEWWTALTKEKL